MTSLSFLGWLVGLGSRSWDGGEEVEEKRIRSERTDGRALAGTSS